MKRSEINNYIRQAKELFNKAGFNLPPFAFWSPDEWKGKGPEADEIRENALGWDITDFGCGRFETQGLLLFTIRNGNYQNPERYPKKYAEKIMIVKPEQVTPMHFHWKKREDIINRSGGNLVLELYKSSEDEQPKISNVIRKTRPIKTIRANNQEKYSQLSFSTEHLTLPRKREFYSLFRI